MSISSSSIAVRQFIALAKGEMERRKPDNPFRVVYVVQQQRYCLRCCGPRTFDVIFKLGALVQEVETAAICRACGKALAHPDWARVHWVGNTIKRQTTDDGRRKAGK